MGVFVVVMLLQVSSACQGRVWASRVHFTLDTKKDDTCYNGLTTSTPKQKKEKNKKEVMSGGKSGKWKVPFSNERLQTSKRTMALSFDLKFALSARHNTAYNNEHKKRVTVPVMICSP